MGQTPMTPEVAVDDVPDAADLRAAVARGQVVLYRLAVRLSMHPVTVGRALNGRIPLTPALAHRIARAIEDEVAAR
jgi:plasmid maintenance system antidote protein VapI